MSTSLTSNALVTSNGSSSGFAQQGSLDWVALGRTKYSVSIAILGRLAKAGIDTLTVAFGQAMCLKLPIGPHGERVLAESMGGLTAKSCAADLIWFGIGVRHILRELTQTSQGCSLVALCAALTEAHSISVSALVLYEIAKECGGPDELAPSVEQWTALIRVASSVFNGTTFGLRISQIGKLHHGQNIRKSPSPHPSDLAKLLLSIGEIINGSLQSISVQGGCCCSWIASWADFVLGLRVLVRNANGDVVYANYKTDQTFAQVDISFLPDGDSGRALHVQSSHLLRSGREFILRCFARPIVEMHPDLNFCAGRLQWETMFSEIFGNQFKVLMTGKNGTPSPLRPFSRREAAEDKCMSEDEIFSRLLAITTIMLAIKSTPDTYRGSATRYYIRAIENVPELRQCNEKTLFAIRIFLTLYGPEESMLDCPVESDSPLLQDLNLEYGDYSDRLRAHCGCRKHVGLSKRNVSHMQFCLPQLAETIFDMISLLDRVILDTPLRPTVYGLHYLYEIESSFYSYNPDAHVDQFARFVNRNWYSVFPLLAAIFSAEEWGSEPQGIVAQSDGKVYCYTQLLEGLTDSMQEARKIHIGSGSIEYRTRLHLALYDTYELTPSSLGYPAQRVEMVDTIESLKSDTTSNSIEARLVVEERPTLLRVIHRTSTSSGDMFISPSGFLYCLQRATSYKLCYKLPAPAHEDCMRVLRGHQYLLVRGEGVVEEADDCHILRPHRGNVLGRCVVISRTAYSPGQPALVRTDEELELFARSWAKMHRDKRTCDGSLLPPYFVLIS